MRLTGLLLAVSCIAFADDPPKQLKGSMKQSAPKMKLDLKFDALPTGSDLKKAKEPAPQQSPSASAAVDSTYTVLSVTNAKSFKGPPASNPITSLGASGQPVMTEKFSTKVKVKCPAKRGAAIELSFLDPRGQSLMDAGGSLVFNGKEEAEWTVDWDATGVRVAGDYAIQVKVGESVLGSYPIKVELK